MRNRLRNLFFIMSCCIISCKKPYVPPVSSTSGSYLVVEGAINTGADSTIILLSRTVSLSTKLTTNPVTGAALSVQGDQNKSYPLIETTPGTYVAAGLNLDNTHKYRLSIKTGSEQYLSDFEPVLNSPPIDSVGFTVANNGVTILSNTHDPTNTVNYYRWEYQETWIFHSNYDSEYFSNGDTVLIRPFSNQVYTCWGNDASSTIIINSSAKLKSAVIANNPIAFVSSTSGKFVTKYSILVKQYALSADAYTFWTNLKKNTEQLGGVFDAQPSQIDGNIHSVTNPSEPVIGYVSVGATASKRIFIVDQQVPAWSPNLPSPCQQDSYLYKYTIPGTTQVINQVDEYINYNKGANYPEIPIGAIAPPGGAPVGYTASTPICVDCTLRGTNIQPPFWQ
jgi:hypothetical protein